MVEFPPPPIVDNSEKPGPFRVTPLLEFMRPPAE